VVENSRRYNCAEVAAWCNNADTIRTIFEASRMVNLPKRYWKDALNQASSTCQLEALTTILAAAGDCFVVSYAPKFLVSFLNVLQPLTSKGKLK
jgi:hypothetical protein